MAVAFQRHRNGLGTHRSPNLWNSSGAVQLWVARGATTSAFCFVAALTLMA